jgi:hypothetical protein
MSRGGPRRSKDTVGSFACRNYGRLVTYYKESSRSLNRNVNLNAPSHKAPLLITRKGALPVLEQGI